MRDKPGLMAQYSVSHNNWQLIGIITYDEFKLVRKVLDAFFQIPNRSEIKEFWDWVVVDESLWRDRRSLYSRYYNKLEKEKASK